MAKNNERIVIKTDKRRGGNGRTFPKTRKREVKKNERKK